MKGKCNLMNKVFGIFVKSGFPCARRAQQDGHLLHLFIAKENAKSEITILKKDYPDHFFYMKLIKLDDA